MCELALANSSVSRRISLITNLILHSSLETLEFCAIVGIALQHDLFKCFGTSQSYVAYHSLEPRTWARCRSQMPTPRPRPPSKVRLCAAVCSARPNFMSSTHLILCFSFSCRNIRQPLLPSSEQTIAAFQFLHQLIVEIHHRRRHFDQWIRGGHTCCLLHAFRRSRCRRSIRYGILRRSRDQSLHEVRSAQEHSGQHQKREERSTNEPCGNHNGESSFRQGQRGRAEDVH